MEIVKLGLSSWEIECGCGFLHQYSVAQTHPLHTHDDFYELFLVMKGKAMHYVNDANIPLEDGAFVLIRPNDSHKYDSFNEYDFELLSIGFLSSLFNKACTMFGEKGDILTSQQLPPMINLKKFDYNDISRKLLHIESFKSSVERKKYFSSILPYILYKFTQEPETTKPMVAPEWLSILIEEMSETDNFIIGLPRMLELTEITQEHLDREFKKHIGMTPTEFINLKRMNYAAELLLNSKMKTTDVCFACGFNNLSHFYHTFKKQYGCSPREFISSYK